jgi:holliday junction DNA helicase RuvA
MITYLKGELAAVLEAGIVVENGGIGYEISVPISVMNELPSIGDQVKIYTFMYVREDALKLYGFLTWDDMNIFKLLITVNGIGPKGALGILSTITPDDLRFAVLAEDVKAIAKAPGIGAKTAGKLILELKDKLKLEDAFEQKVGPIENGLKDTGNVASNIRNEAIQALVALGYSNTEALKAVRQVEITAGMKVEDVLKLGLKKVSL